MYVALATMHVPTLHYNHLRFMFFRTFSSVRCKICLHFSPSFWANILNSVANICVLLLQVNGVDFEHVEHSRAVEVLRSSGHSVAMHVERQGAVSAPAHYATHQV